MNIKVGSLMMVSLLFFVGLGSAQAAMVVYEDVGFISIQDKQKKPESFTISTAGKYQLDLVDFTFPKTFKTLELKIIGGSTSRLHEVARLDSPGEIVFDAIPGLYYAALYGEVDSILGLGLYGIQVSSTEMVAPVPLPAAGWLLGSALVSLVAFKKKSGSLKS